MQLSANALKDLRATIESLLGKSFITTDTELNEIGVFLLTSLAEVLKHKTKSSLS